MPAVITSTPAATTTDHPEGFVSWIYPDLTRCPHCTGTHWREAGHNGRKRYRRCLTCGNGYGVAPIAMQLDHGGRASVVQPL